MDKNEGQRLHFHRSELLIGSANLTPKAVESSRDHNRGLSTLDAKRG